MKNAILPTLACLLLAVPALAGDPQVVRPDPLKLLLLDRRAVESTNLRLVLGSPRKDPANPLFRADKPWENALNNLYPNVLWDETDRRFKLWYKCVLADKEAIAKMDGPSTVHDVGWYLLYATSGDGVRWEKPALGLHAFGGEKGTNVVARDTPNVGVFRDAHDADPARRFKMIYDVGLGQPRVRFSSDGIRWGDPVEAKGFGPRNGDTHNNAFFDDRLGKYVAFTKLYLGERTVARFESDDFVNWKPSGMVLRSTVDEGRASQTYCMPVFRYANIYLGYVMMYHVGKDRAVDCELAWSPDGMRWERVMPGTPFVPRGPRGSYDALCVYAQAGPPVARDGRLMIYYGGSDVPHTGWKRHCLPCLATVRLDGFAGYTRVPGTPGVLTTTPLRIADAVIRVSADTDADGSVQVEALDEQGRVVAAGELPNGELTDEPVRWERFDAAKARGTVVRLRFKVLGGVTLYAIRGVELVDTTLAPPPAPPVSAIDPATAPVLRVSFNRDAEGWTGVDKIEHHPAGGAAGGYVSFARAGGLRPIANAPQEPAKSPLAGSWVEKFGRNDVSVSFAARSKQAGGRMTVELFARDIAQWSYTPAGELKTEWATFAAPLRPDWTDEQAKAAGWRPAQNAFTWRETMDHVGRVTVLPVGGGPEGFDLDEVEVRVAR
ncbi:MAG TPA: hypothetical protein VF796_27160 [Humisphaera sp.]